MFYVKIICKRNVIYIFIDCRILFNRHVQYYALCGPFFVIFYCKKKKV